MTEHVPSKEQLPQGWIPLGQGFGWIADRLMLKTPEFILNNWDCKYVNARIDMRTGSVRLEPGNVNSAHLREMPHCSTCSCPPYDAERQAAQIATLKGYISRTALAGYRCAECAERLAPAITSHTVEITAEQRQMLTARGVGEIPGGAHEPPAAPVLSFGKVVTDGQIVAIYAGEEGAEFKLLRHNVHGALSEVRRPWNMRSTFRPATYDEMRAACPHDWLIERYCSICRPSKPPGDGQ